MTRRAFVTGATGFVGGHVARTLVERGWSVTALARKGSSLDRISDAGIDIRRGDITDPVSIREAIPDGTDAVFHVAASTSIWSRHNDMQTRVNVDGTRNVIDASIAAGVGRLVHTSSFIVWGFYPAVLTEECEPVAGDDWINYIRTKRLAEGLVKSAVARGDIEAVICNPAHILGPGDRTNWARMILMLDRGELPGVPPGGGAFADVREVARAHVEAFDRGRNGLNYILGGEEARFEDVIRMTGEILGTKVPRWVSPAWMLRAAAHVETARAALTGREPQITPEGVAMITRHIRCDSSRARQELGYRFTPIRKLLQDTCDWLRKAGLLR